MKTIILINLNTIKKNSNSGYNVLNVPIREEITFEIKAKKLPDYMIYTHWDEGTVKINPNRNCEVSEIEYQSFDSNFKIFTGMIIDPGLIDIINDDKNLISKKINHNRQYHTIQGFEPTYTYKYIHVEVQCNECEKTFMSDQLLYVCDEEYSSGRICPFCGEWDCCHIDYEN